MLFNGFDNITESISFKLFFSEDRVEIRALDGDVGKLSLINIPRVHWVSHKSLIVWNWPGWGGHNSKGMVSFWIHGSEEGILRRETSLSNYCKIASIKIFFNTYLEQPIFLLAFLIKLY